MPNTASLQLSTGMTLEAWVSPTTVSSGWRDVIYKGNDNYYLMGTTDQSGHPGGGGIFGGTNANAFATSALPTNTWSYLTTSYDGTNLRLYLNGTLTTTVAMTGAITSTTNPLTIGSDSFWGQYFSGLIDNIRIYNTALTQTQIQTDMTTPIGNYPSAPGTLTTNVAGGSEVDLTGGRRRRVSRSPATRSSAARAPAAATSSRSRHRLEPRTATPESRRTPPTATGFAPWMGQEPARTRTPRPPSPGSRSARA